MEEKKKTKRVKIEVVGGVCYVREIPDRNIVVEVVDFDNIPDGAKTVCCLGKDGDIIERGDK